MKIIVIYDNNIPKSEYISDIIGNKSFGDIVVKKQRTEIYTKNIILSLFKDVIWKCINSIPEYIELLNYMKEYENDDVKIFHYFSNYFISDKEKVALSYQKLLYIDTAYKNIWNKKISGIMFPNVSAYLPFCKNLLSGLSVADSSEYIKNSFEIEGYSDLSQINDFLQCITNNIDLRYFNSLEDNEYTITKTSKEKLKIKKEYTFYQLLPEDMKYWFVMPFNYVETEETASYTMEKLHLTDLAIKYVHGSINEDEFNNLLEKYFYFFKVRHSRSCMEEEYKRTQTKLYETKVLERIDEFKHHPDFEFVNQFVKCTGISIDNLVEKYFNLKQKIESRNKYLLVDVIGHGDPGFANTLYNKATNTLKFIDPKGALTEEELWTNPYYDIAKLSHCICGKYDFFNNNLFEIKLNNNFGFELEIPFNNELYKSVFKEKVKANGFDYYTVRIYEVSLFLSMLPLHMDNPFKVFGFILNARNIIDEIEKEIAE